MSKAFSHVLGKLIEGMGNGEDRGQSFPASDARDFVSGARFIPSPVTLARCDGDKVEFVQKCGPCCWYWKMPDGSKIHHWDPMEAKAIRKHNTDAGKCPADLGDAGPCPQCGNVETNGGTSPK